MTTAKLFDHEGVQAVDLPADFHSETSEVEIERHGDELVLRPKQKMAPNFETPNDFAQYMHDNFPGGATFSEVERQTVAAKNLRPKFETLSELADYFRENHPEGADFPDIERAGPDQNRSVGLD